VRFTVEYPVAAHDYNPELLTSEGMATVVRAVEDAGYDAVAFTEHPAPSRRWLEAGGHESLDCTTALAFCAAVTRRISLMTFLMVLPYRNPFLSAKSMATVDLLSDGRAVLVAGAGYMKSEYSALGVDFEERNALFDEAVEVMKGVWTTDTFDYEGRHFTARGVAQQPKPVQPGGPPIWIGGNSPLSRRRAARLQGWSPMVASEQLARTTRTISITTVEELGSAIGEVVALAQELHGDGHTLAIQTDGGQGDFIQRLVGPTPLSADDSVEKHRDHLGRLAEVGVTQFVVQPPGDGIEVVVEALNRYAEVVKGV
jgi:probable F420-dependent oxidoreductase